MKQIFAKLREGERANSSSYLTSLFPRRWWVQAETKPDASVPVEKMEAISSLGRFVEQKSSSGQKSIKFSGGEIATKETSHSSQITLPAQAEFYDQVGECSKCSSQLCKPMIVRTQGPLEVLFIGDFPREIDQASLLPDKNDQLLNKMCAAMKLEQGEFAKSLAVKCLGEGDMSNRWQEMGKNCLEHLQREIALLAPKVVITLGAVATRLLLAKDVKLSAVHGKFHPQKLTFSGKEFEYQLVPIFQLDLLMINPNMKKTTWNDLQEVMKHIGKL